MSVFYMTIIDENVSIMSSASESSDFMALYKSVFNILTFINILHRYVFTWCVKCIITTLIY